MQKSSIYKLLIFTLVIKVLYLVFSYSFDKKNQTKNIYDHTINLYKKFDSYWYFGIAKNGYPKIKNKRDLGYSEEKNIKQSEWAFFPLYPVLIKQFSLITGASPNLSALFWSLFFSAFAIIGLYKFGIIFFDNENLAFYNAILLFTFPFSFYFSMFYTEAIFFALMIHSFLAIHNKNYWLLSFLLVPLILVRPNGLILLLPLYIFFLERNNLIIKWDIHWRKILSKTSIIRSLFFITGPLTFATYSIYQYQMTGFYNAFSIAQNGWNKEFTFPLFSFFNRGDIGTQFNSIYAILAIIFTIYSFKKLPLSLNILVWISLILPLTAGSVTSMTRYISVLFPLFLILSSIIYNHKYKYWILSILLILHFVTFYAWVFDYPIAY